MQSNEMALQQINGSAMNVISMMLICCLVSFLETGHGVVVLDNTAADVTIAHWVERGGAQRP